ncbi:MAG: hypothetical protein DHS20C10_11150 [marine bacterium B5-7]|nr:MAG: hypothetical protein DHS20C10_11150 [marine bacterium B5-7]
MRNKKTVQKNMETTDKVPQRLLTHDVAKLIDEARGHVAREYSSTQAILCWLIGKRINEEVLKSDRAEYGEAIVTVLAKDLTFSFGKGYSRPNLFRMIKFAKQFPDRDIVSTLSRQLSWSHLVPVLQYEYCTRGSISYLTGGMATVLIEGLRMERRDSCRVGKYAPHRLTVIV